MRKFHSTQMIAANVEKHVNSGMHFMVTERCIRLSTNEIAGRPSAHLGLLSGGSIILNVNYDFSILVLRLLFIKFFTTSVAQISACISFG